MAEEGPVEPPTGAEEAANAPADEGAEAPPEGVEAPTDGDEGGEEGGGGNDEEEMFFSALEDEEGEEAGEGEDSERIAEDILQIILKDTDNIVNQTTSLDSLILSELRETEDRIQELAIALSAKKQEIKKLREKKHLTADNIEEIDTKQLEIQEMIEEFEQLTSKMKELLEQSIRPSSLPRPEPFPPIICPLCEKESCICRKVVQTGPEPVCLCETEICTCEHQSYKPGQWLEQQVSDLFPLKREPPVCICGSAPIVCVCPSKEAVKECVCKKEDLKEFNMVIDVMPKVVVCAPDVSLPRIIVCEPYIPKKPAPKKPHVCERNRACKLYKYPGF